VIPLSQNEPRNRQKEGTCDKLAYGKGSAIDQTQKTPACKENKQDGGERGADAAATSPRGLKGWCMMKPLYVGPPEKKAIESVENGWFSFDTQWRSFRDAVSQVASIPVL